MSLGLVFTSNWVVVRVVIRSAEWYYVMKIKDTKSEAECQFSLWSRENYIVGVKSRGRGKDKLQSLNLSLVIGSSLHSIINVGVANTIRRKWKHSDSSDLMPLSLWLHLWIRLWFSLSQKCSCDSKWLWCYWKAALVKMTAFTRTTKTCVCMFNIHKTTSKQNTINFHLL